MGVRSRVVAAIACAASWYALSAHAAVTVEQSALLGGVDADAACPVALSADGSRALLASPGDNLAGTQSGRVNSFLRSGSSWAPEATLLASDAAQFDNFGRGIAMSSDNSRLVVGVIGDDVGSAHDAGSARVFERTSGTWTEEATLAPATFVGGYFGSAVAITANADRVLVGARFGDFTSQPVRGAAFVYARAGSTWSLEAAFQNPEPVSLRYGQAVALSSDGTRAAISTANLAGGVEIRRRNGNVWTQEAWLTPAGGGTNDFFGSSIAMSADGDRVVVGSPFTDTAGGVDAGSARVFARVGTTWSEEALLVASDGAAGDRLAEQVALSGNGSRLLLSDAGDVRPSGSLGSARLFIRSGSAWLEDTIIESAPTNNEALGATVALSGDGKLAAISARSTTGLGSCKARVFAFSAPAVAAPALARWSALALAALMVGIGAALARGSRRVRNVRRLAE